MAYQRKTEDEYQLVYDYGYGAGPEIICRESTMREAKQTKQDYILNEGICPSIRKRRVKKYETSAERNQ